MIHPTEIDDPGGLGRLAEDLGNLRYDVLESFLNLLAEEVRKDGHADAGRGRAQLAAALAHAADSIGQAWKTSEP
jgi:hypothetical protein